MSMDTGYKLSVIEEEVDAIVVILMVQHGYAIILVVVA